MKRHFSNAEYAILCFFAICVLKTSIANSADMTLDIIAENLKVAESKIADISLDFDRMVQFPGSPSDKIEGTWSHKHHINGYFSRISYKQFQIDPNTGQSSAIADDDVVFNGRCTKILQRMSKNGRPMEGSILSGDQCKLFGFCENPYSIGAGGPLLYDLIRGDEYVFNMDKDSEMMNGVVTAKLIGKSKNGAVRMTVWIDPERSYLPIRVLIESTSLLPNRPMEVVANRFLSDVIKLPNRSWYPKTIRYDDRNGATYIIYRVLQISPASTKEPFFDFQFPPNIHVVDEVEGISYTTY